MTRPMATVTGLRMERVLASAHYREGTFRNTKSVGPGLKRGSRLSTLGEFFFSGNERKPPAPLPSEDPRPLWQRPISTGLRATWLGHSTVLVEIDGFRVLTDPVWGERASPSTFVGPKRFQPVPVNIAGLPSIDAVVISHDHYDHLDRPTILELAKLTDVPFVTSLGVGAHLEGWGVPADRIIELDWWEAAKFRGGDLAITATPSQHFSGRTLLDRNHTLWSSFVIETAHHKAFFSGDTRLTPEYGEIRARFAPFDLVMLEVGAFHPSWGDIHLGPKNALAALELLGGGPLLPVHWGTFNLAIHAWDDPAETLAELGGEQRAHLVMPRLGSPVEPANTHLVEPWWRSVGIGAPDRARSLI